MDNKPLREKKNQVEFPLLISAAHLISPPQLRLLGKFENEPRYADTWALKGGGEARTARRRRRMNNVFVVCSELKGKR